MRVKEHYTDLVTFVGHLDGQRRLGFHVATIESDSGLAEYIVVYDGSVDKVMAYQKVYLNPDDPAEFSIRGISNPHLLNEIGHFCVTEGLFDHLPEKLEDERQAD